MRSPLHSGNAETVFQTTSPSAMLLERSKSDNFESFLEPSPDKLQLKHVPLAGLLKKVKRGKGLYNFFAPLLGYCGILDIQLQVGMA